MPAQLELTDLGPVHGAEVAEGFLAETDFFSGCQQLHAETSSHAVIELAHQRIVSVPQQSVYTMNPGGYFLNPIYNGPAITKQQNKQAILLQTRLKEETEMPRDPDVESMVKSIDHETRRQIMRVYLERSDRAISPREIADRVGVRLSTVSYHVRVLVNCEALVLVSTRPVRGAIQHFYRPSEAFEELAWVPKLLALSSEAAT